MFVRVLHRSQTVSQQVVVVVLREGRAFLRENLATQRVMLDQVILENGVQGNVRLCHFCFRRVHIQCAVELSSRALYRFVELLDGWETVWLRWSTRTNMFTFNARL